MISFPCVCEFTKLFMIYSKKLCFFQVEYVETDWHCAIECVTSERLIDQMVSETSFSQS